jgi:hypothetical protein
VATRGRDDDAQPSAEARIDRFPRDPAQREAMRAEERIALHLDSIRKSLAALVLVGIGLFVLGGCALNRH